MIPDDMPPCHGLGHLFISGRVDPDLLPSLLACCRRCHLTRECAQLALQVEASPASAVTGIWGGVYIDAPSRHRGPVNERRLEALAQLRATAEGAPAERATAVAR